jgi:hypothetical protein
LIISGSKNNTFWKLDLPLSSGGEGKITKELGSVRAQGHTRIGFPTSPFYLKAEADAASKTLWVFFEPGLVDSVPKFQSQIFFSQAVTCDRSSTIPSMGTRHHQFQYRK